jgi:hypothetical protein
LGDELRWRGPVPASDSLRAAIYGISEECPHCGKAGEKFVIELENNRFVRVVHDPAAAEGLRRQAS